MPFRADDGSTGSPRADRPVHHPGGFTVLEAHDAGPAPALAGWSSISYAALEESGGGGGLGVE